MYLIQVEIYQNIYFFTKEKKNMIIQPQHVQLTFGTFLLFDDLGENYKSTLESAKNRFLDRDGRYFATLQDLIDLNAKEHGIDNTTPLSTCFYQVDDFESFNSFMALNPQLRHIEPSGKLYFKKDVLYFNYDTTISKGQYVNRTGIDLFDLFNKEMT